MAEVLSRNWGPVLVRGVAALIFGLLVLFAPAISLAVLVIYFGALSLVDGFAAVATAVENRRGEQHWVGFLVSGLLGIAVGVVTFIWPGVTALALVYLIAFWAIVIGLGEIAAAIRIRRMVTGEWVLLLAGTLSVVFGVLIALFPGAGALALVAWLGWFAFVVGVLRIVEALRLRERLSPRSGTGGPIAP